jgi:dCTP deaminase
MILSDQDIIKAVKDGWIVIDPFDSACVQPSSYDLHLTGELLVFDNHRVGVVDVRKRAEVSHLVTIDEKEGFVLHPGEFILGSTVECFKIPSDLAAKLEGKSSLGRLGLIIHATAGFVDPGFEGQLTFEISNISRLPIRIYPGMKIAQICFFRMTSPAKTPYGSKKLGSKYKGQKGPTGSRIYLDFFKNG